MFDRSLLKANAKVPLRSTYWTAFGVSLVFSLASGLLSGGTGSSGSSSYNPTPVIPPNVGGYDFIPESSGFFDFALVGSMVGVFLAVFLFLSLVGMVLSFFIINPLEVGKDRFFIYNRRYPSDFATLFSGFKTSYLNIVKTLAVRDVLIFLWSLLFIIPGVIMSYSYQMMPYILAENPNMPPKRVMQISKDMTEGYKWDLLVLDLSFIGWILLGVLACGVGVLFVNPYVEATKTEAYEFLKQQALQKGVCDISEFN